MLHVTRDVFRVLDKVLTKATPKLATDLTTFVDKFGKAVIRVGQYKECHKLSDQISALTRISHARRQTTRQRRPPRMPRARPPPARCRPSRRRPSRAPERTQPEARTRC